MDKIDIVLVTHQKKEAVQNQINEIEANTPELHRLIATCQPLCAAHNRNYGLSWANSEVIVMMDDDMTGFYKGWLTDFVTPMLKDPNIIVSSARLMDTNRNIGHTMGASRIPHDAVGIYDAERFAYKDFQRVATACIAIRKNPVRFDEQFIGSGYEDTDYMNRINMAYPDCRIVVNCNCKLIHINEEKNQGGRYFESNHAYYMRKYPDDMTVKNQTDWTKRKR